jgi:hypothetical protein
LALVLWAVVQHVDVLVGVPHGVDLHPKNGSCGFLFEEFVKSIISSPLVKYL